MATPEFLGLLVAIIGCFVGLAGWLSRRDKKIATDAEWRGKVDTKLDTILMSQRDICKDLDKLEIKVENQGERLIKVEESTRSAHHLLEEQGHRLDEIQKSKKEG